MNLIEKARFSAGLFMRYFSGAEARSPYRMEVAWNELNLPAMNTEVSAPHGILEVDEAMDGHAFGCEFEQGGAKFFSYGLWNIEGKA